MDRRVRKTKAEIKSALFKVAAMKGIENVSVQEIIVSADINRTTFYYHYKDKIDLIENIESETLEGLLQELVIPDQVKSFIDILYPPILASLEHVKRFEEIYTTLLSNKGITDFRWKMLNIIKFSVRKSIEQLQKNYNIEITIDKSFLENFIAGAHLSVILDWVNNGLDSEPNLIAKQLARVLTDGVYKEFSTDFVK